MNHIVDNKFVFKRLVDKDVAALFSAIVIKYWLISILFFTKLIFF